MPNVWNHCIVNRILFLFSALAMQFFFIFFALAMQVFNIFCVGIASFFLFFGFWSRDLFTNLRFTNLQCLKWNGQKRIIWNKAGREHGQAHMPTKLSERMCVWCISLGARSALCACASAHALSLNQFDFWFSPSATFFPDGCPQRS